MARSKWSDADLSAFVDGQLDPAQVRVLESAIAQEPALRAQVDQLRQLTTLLKAAPLREPPRNYLLTPAMVSTASVSKPQAQRKPALRWMRFATSLVAAAFAVSIGMNLVGQRVGPSMMLAPESAAETAPEPRVAATAPASQEVVETFAVEEPAASEMLVGSAPEATPVPPSDISQDTNIVAEEEPAPAEDASLARMESESAPAGMGPGEMPTATLEADAPLAAAPVEPTVAAEAALKSAPDDATPTPATEAPAAMLMATEPETQSLESAPVEEMLRETAPENVPQPAVDTERPVIARRLMLPVWVPWLLGALTALCAGLTIWLSRRR
jgi:hypothetical protein